MRTFLFILTGFLLFYILCDTIHEGLKLSHKPSPPRVQDADNQFDCRPEHLSQINKCKECWKKRNELCKHFKNNPTLKKFCSQKTPCTNVCDEARAVVKSGECYGHKLLYKNEV